MEKIKLTKREYLGEGYFNQHKNIETGEILKQEISSDEYRGIIENNCQAKPIEGYIWESSYGGAILVDTPSKELGLNEGAVVGDVHYVSEFDVSLDTIIIGSYPEEEFNNKFIWQ